MRFFVCLRFSYDSPIVGCCVLTVSWQGEVSESELWKMVLFWLDRPPQPCTTAKGENKKEIQHCFPLKYWRKNIITKKGRWKEKCVGISRP